ncbi:MAG: DUF502 domain-containing protein [Bdellovibrionota bacterium]
MDESLPLKIRTLLKQHFIAGVFVLIPLVVIGWILFAALEAVWQLHDLIPARWSPENVLQNKTLGTLINILITAAVVFLLAMVISILGWASKLYFGKKTLEYIAHIIERIPVIRSIYGALDQLFKTLGSGGNQQFSRVVYVEYPRKNVWAIAFVTSPARAPGIPPGHLNIFLPATPNPTSGFHLIVAETEVRETNMKVEEAFKTILSLGIAQGVGNRKDVPRKVQ